MSVCFVVVGDRRVDVFFFRAHRTHHKNIKDYSKNNIGNPIGITQKALCFVNLWVGIQYPYVHVHSSH